MPSLKGKLCAPENILLKKWKGKNIERDKGAFLTRMSRFVGSSSFDSKEGSSV